MKKFCAYVRQQPGFIILLWVSGAFVVLAWVLYAYFTPLEPKESWGIFGDKFGALNTLFTGLAFVGLLAALWHERASAADREKEHSALLAAMAAQVKAMEKASRIAAIRARLEVYASEQQGMHPSKVRILNRFVTNQARLTKELDRILSEDGDDNDHAASS